MSEWFSGIKAKFILDFIAKQRWKYITDGLKVTLEVTFLALILGLVLGAVIAVIRTTHAQLIEDQSNVFGRFLTKLADLICRVYLPVIRGSTTMVQLLHMFFIVKPALQKSKLFYSKKEAQIGKSRCVSS